MGVIMMMLELTTLTLAAFRDARVKAWNRIVLAREDDPGEDYPLSKRKLAQARNAHTRHKRRVCATVAAALEAAAEVLAHITGEYFDDDETPQLRRLAALLVRMDLEGIGGEMGFYGYVNGGAGSTERMPPFRSLGSGRWQAGDGGAYRAAAEEALELLRYPRGEDDDVERVFEGSVEDAQLLAQHCPPSWGDWLICFVLRQIDAARDPKLAHDWDWVGEIVGKREGLSDFARQLALEYHLV